MCTSPGGTQVGVVFVGWLTAVVLALLLTALAAGVGVTIGTGAHDSATYAPDSGRGIGPARMVTLLVILFIAFLVGGYVAARLASSGGGRQGVAVWLGAALVSIVLAALGLVAGDSLDVLTQIDVLASIPVRPQQAATGRPLPLVTTAPVTLLGAVLGGFAGERHRRMIHAADLPM
ncbi:hypothetical protein [Janibacter terrae]|uniref:hypothetical protein n=1 Tax=Janibacter terrae TaxID=103817 RepID=UPI0008329FC5|nr:hypothetical protein [Janibacter terrae]HCA88525.1 hypothetical protein [Streptomyces sp.]